MASDTPPTTARQGEPELIGEILPRVLVDLDRRRRKPSPDQLASTMEDDK